MFIADISIYFTAPECRVGPKSDTILRNAQEGGKRQKFNRNLGNQLDHGLVDPIPSFAAGVNQIVMIRARNLSEVNIFFRW